MTLTKEQKLVRHLGVGGSEILAALGKDPRCSRLELYLRKRGELPEPDLEKNERVWFGQLLEPVIRDEVARRIRQDVLTPTSVLVHPTHPVIGTPDGWIPARSCGLEIKTADKHEAEEFGEPWTDQVPVRYLVQCTHYMVLKQSELWLLAVLIGGNDLRIYEIPFDRDIGDLILTGAQAFWKHVQDGIPPDCDTPEDVRLRWPKDNGRAAIATPEIEELCGHLAGTKGLIKQAKAEEEKSAAALQAYMQEASTLVSPSGKVLATWRTSKAGRFFDVESFREDHPATAELYTRNKKAARPFLLKGVT